MYNARQYLHITVYMPMILCQNQGEFQRYLLNHQLQLHWKIKVTIAPYWDCNLGDFLQFHETRRLLEITGGLASIELIAGELFLHSPFYPTDCLVFESTETESGQRC